MDVRFFRFVSFVFLVSAVLLSLVPRLFAQDVRSGPGVVALQDFPDAPNAQPAQALSPQAQPGAVLDDRLFDTLRADVVESGPLQSAQQPASSPAPLPAWMSGTVTDANGDPIAGATVTIQSADPTDQRSAVAGDNGAFEFDDLKPGVEYHVSVSAKDMQAWQSPPIVLTPGQYFLLTDIKLRLPGSEVSVTVYASQEQIATEQVIVAEKQRVFGIIPNFYVTYDPHPVPLTTRLKYKLALRASTDPITYFGIAFMAAIYQAGDVPDYQQGWDGYAQRVGAGIADTTTDIFFGGAILPSLLHQDPRYFYQGTGTKKSRFLHAISYPYICKGDNGKTQPNYSSLGGDLISGAISNIYYPETNRGAGLVFEGFFVTTAVRTVNSIIQEFLLRKLTPSARQKN
jgi:hypothetical protein